MVLKSFPIQDTMGWILGRTWHLGRCRWYRLQWQSPGTGRRRQRFWFRRGFLLQTPWCSKENRPSCCSKTADHMMESTLLVHGDMDHWWGVLWWYHYFFLYFLYFPFRSVPLFPLHSAPSPTHDPLIFQYFIDCHRTSCFLAPLCWQTWTHSIHETYPTYDMYWRYWNTFLPVHIPW